MIDYVALLKATPNGVLATRDGQDIKTRVFQFLFADGKKLYFCTNSEKPVYSQLNADSNVSFCVPGDFSPVLSVNGKVFFDEDISLKTRALEESPLIKTIYNSPDNPIFKIFYIDVEEVETFGFSEGPKSYKL